MLKPYKALLAATIALPLSYVALVQSSVAANEPDLSLKQKVEKIMLTNDSFVERATLSNLAEIESSKVALEKSTSPQIQTFAQQMIKDHGAASAELAVIANSKNIKVPTKLDDKHEDAIRRLRNLSGADFDKAYISRMKEDHNDAVSLFEVASADKDLDGDLHKFAQKTLPILQSHHEQTMQLK